MFEEIIQKLKTILSNNNLLSDVYAYEKIQTDSDPYANIVPSSNESDYSTTEENVRIYAFKVQLFVSRTVRSKKEAERVMRELVDSVIDDCDKDYTLETVGVPTKTGYTFLQTFATPSYWGYVGEEDQYRVATIDLTCLVSVDLNAIS